MESHKLHLLPGYEADLTSTLDGSLKLYPSRWLAFRGTAPVDIAAVLSSLESSPRYGLYGTITSPFSAVDVADLVQHTDLGDLVGVGDINLAQTETSGGQVYSEVFVQVDPENLPKQYLYLPDKPIPDNETIINRLLGSQPQPTSNGWMEFNTIVILYNVYRKAENETLQDMILKRDFPMAIVELPEMQALRTTNNLGGVTTWSTKVLTRVTGKNSKLPANDTDLHTLGRLLTEMGRLQKKMDQIVSSRVTDYGSFKAYLDKFRNEQSINVPYIVAGRWFVNGKDIGPVIDDLRLKNLVESYIEEHKESFRGPQGDPGADGKTPEFKISDTGELLYSYGDGQWKSAGIFRAQRVSAETFITVKNLSKPAASGKPAKLILDIEAYKEWTLNTGGKEKEDIGETATIHLGEFEYTFTPSRQQRLELEIPFKTEYSGKSLDGTFIIGTFTQPISVTWKKAVATKRKTVISVNNPSVNPFLVGERGTVQFLVTAYDEVTYDSGVTQNEPMEGDPITYTTNTGSATLDTSVVTINTPVTIEIPYTASGGQKQPDKVVGIYRSGNALREVTLQWMQPETGEIVVENLRVEVEKPATVTAGQDYPVTFKVSGAAFDKWDDGTLTPKELTGNVVINGVKYPLTGGKVTVNIPYNKSGVTLQPTFEYFDRMMPVDPITLQWDAPKVVGTTPKVSVSIDRDTFEASENPATIRLRYVSKAVDTYDNGEEKERFEPTTFNISGAITDSFTSVSETGEKVLSVPRGERIVVTSGDGNGSGGEYSKEFVLTWKNKTITTSRDELRLNYQNEYVLRAGETRINIPYVCKKITTYNDGSESVTHLSGKSVTLSSEKWLRPYSLDEPTGTIEVDIARTLSSSREVIIGGDLTGKFQVRWLDATEVSHEDTIRMEMI
jgi:hypothetical protein|nr:MAG TPA: hypothetical protein [Caudoviricetes sp.]